MCFSVALRVSAALPKIFMEGRHAGELLIRQGSSKGAA